MEPTTNPVNPPQPVTPPAHEAAPAATVVHPIVGGNLESKAKTSMILGIIGLFGWFIPIIGLPVTIVGLVKGTKGLHSATKRGMAKAGVILCVIGLLLSIVNASIGAYLGATGQHPVVNEMMR